MGKMCIIRHFTKKCITATKHSWKKFEAIDKRSTVDTIYFSDLFLFFPPYCMNWPEMLHPPFLFLWKAREKGSFFITTLSFCNQSHKIHSIPHFLTGSFAALGITCGPFSWGSFAVLYNIQFCFWSVKTTLIRSYYATCILVSTGLWQCCVLFSLEILLQACKKHQPRPVHRQKKHIQTRFSL